MNAGLKLRLDFTEIPSINTYQLIGCNSEETDRIHIVQKALADSHILHYAPGLHYFENSPLRELVWSQPRILQLHELITTSEGREHIYPLIQLLIPGGNALRASVLVRKEKFSKQSSGWLYRLLGYYYH
jgi:hypothetical protein